MPIEGIESLFREQASQTKLPHERQLCLSLASCASLSNVLAHVNLLAQHELFCKQKRKDYVQS